MGVFLRLTSPFLVIAKRNLAEGAGTAVGDLQDAVETTSGYLNDSAALRARGRLIV